MISSFPTLWDKFVVVAHDTFARGINYRRSTATTGCRRHPVRGDIAGTLATESFACARAINGKPARLVVDTGAPVSAIALNRRRHFGLTPFRLNRNFRLSCTSMEALTRRHRPAFPAWCPGVYSTNRWLLIDMSSSTRAAKALNEEPSMAFSAPTFFFPRAPCRLSDADARS